MNWQQLFQELSATLSFREIAEQVGLKSASQAHRISTGRQKTVTYEVGKAALDLARKIRRKANALPVAQKDIPAA